MLNWKYDKPKQPQMVNRYLTKLATCKNDEDEDRSPGGTFRNHFIYIYIYTYIPNDRHYIRKPCHPFHPVIKTKGDEFFLQENFYLVEVIPSSRKYSFPAENFFLAEIILHCENPFTFDDISSSRKQIFLVEMFLLAEIISPLRKWFLAYTCRFRASVLPATMREIWNV